MEAAPTQFPVNESRGITITSFPDPELFLEVTVSLFSFAGLLLRLLRLLQVQGDK